MLNMQIPVSYTHLIYPERGKARAEPEKSGNPFMDIYNEMKDQNTLSSRTVTASFLMRQSASSNWNRSLQRWAI